MIYGGFWSEHANVEVASDIKIAAMLLLSAILFLTLFIRIPGYLSLLLSAFIGALFARHLVDLIYLVSNFGPRIALDVSRGSTDSAKGCVIYLMYFGIMLVWVKKRMLLGSAIAILSTILLAAYGTRMLWITALIGAIVFLFLLRVRQSIKFIAVVSLLIMGGLWGLSTFKPDTAEVVFARAKGIIEGYSYDQYVVAAEYNNISKIDQVRYGEMVNILHSTDKRFSY